MAPGRRLHARATDVIGLGTADRLHPQTQSTSSVAATRASYPAAGRGTPPSSYWPNPERLIVQINPPRPPPCHPAHARCHLRTPASPSNAVSTAQEQEQEMHRLPYDLQLAVLRLLAVRDIVRLCAVSVSPP